MSEHFGWADHQADPEAYWERRAREVRAQIEAEERRLAAQREHRYRQLVDGLIVKLIAQNLLRVDRLSYSRICQLEHSTGLVEESSEDYHAALLRAAELDRGEGENEEDRAGSDQRRSATGCRQLFQLRRPPGQGRRSRREPQG